MAVTTINFIQQHTLYEEEKPYLLTYEPPNDFPKTNVKLDKREMSINDIRGNEQDFTIDQNGFSIMKIESKLSYEDFNDADLVKSIYLREVAETVKELLGASRVQIFEHLVSFLFLFYFLYIMQALLFRVEEV